MSLLRRALNALTFPIRRILDPRFHDISHRIALTQQGMQGLERRLDDVTASQVEALTILGQDLRLTSSGVTDLREAVANLTIEDHERFYRERMARVVSDQKLRDLDQQSADLINFAQSHRGFAAQEGLWLNPPVVIEHRAGEVRLATVNERIVEIPFAMRALGGIEVGGRVLDFGSSESQVALSLASLGFEVTALDLSGYPFTHPNLEAVRSPLEQWVAPAGSFDAATIISTVEHVGLGWYGEAPGQFDDLQAMRRIAELVRPGGLIVLTVPYGKAEITDVQRIYDAAGVDGLLAGLETTERIVVEERDGTWVRVEESDGHAVAMVTARVPAS